MPYNLLLLPLLAGYCFTHACHYFRFRSQRLDGYRLLLESALAGVGLVTLSRLGVLGLKATAPGRWLKVEWDLFCPFQYSATAGGAVWIGLTLAVLVNLKFKKDWAKDRVLQNGGNALFKLLHDAAQLRKPIAITLDSRKWYMGYVRESPNLDPQEQYFVLLPILSGYRSADTLTIEQMVFYELAYEGGVDRNALAITLPLNTVKIASFYQQEAYDTFFTGRRRRARPRPRAASA